MDNKKFRVWPVKETHVAPRRGLYTLTAYAVRQPGCNHESFKECQRDRHPYCRNYLDYIKAIETASYYGGLLNRNPGFRDTITTKPAPKKRKRQYSWK